MCFKNVLREDSFPCHVSSTAPHMYPFIIWIVHIPFYNPLYILSTNQDQNEFKDEIFYFMILIFIQNSFFFVIEYILIMVPLQLLLLDHAHIPTYRNPLLWRDTCFKTSYQALITDAKPFFFYQHWLFSGNELIISYHI